MKYNARYWEKTEDRVLCKLCPHNCLIPLGKRGFCRARININNELISLNYGEVTAIALDPIEKKPLYHYKPGSYILSVSTYGCNMHCDFCQNYDLSQHDPFSRLISPKELVKIILKYDHNIGIAFTYNEPFIWYEYIYDCAKLLKTTNKDKDVVLVTNGFINPEPLKELLPYIDAMNIDLKSYNADYYRKICKATLEPVLETIKIAQENCFIEITTLIVTNENDNLEEIEKIAKFIASIDKDIPFHLSRYYPNYKMTTPPTPVSFMKQAKEVAEKHLNYVYVGNIPYEDRNTYCPNCKALVIDRTYGNFNQICPKCGTNIPLIV